MRLQDVKMTDQIARHEIDGREIARHEIAGHENAKHKRAEYEPNSEAANV